jgi:hypothetical protein
VFEPQVQLMLGWPGEFVRENSSVSTVRGCGLDERIVISGGDTGLPSLLPLRGSKNDVKNGWSSTSTPKIFHGVKLELEAQTSDVSKFSCYRSEDVGRDSSVGIATGNWRGGPGRLWDPPSLLCNGYWVFSGGKAAGAWT